MTVTTRGWLGQRRTLVMLDQGASSLSNIVVTVIAARALEPVAFGAFSAAMVGYQLVLGGVRAGVGEPWLSGHAVDGRGERQRAIADLMHAAVGLSSLCAVLLLVAASVVTGPSGGPLLALALVFPILGLQDALRFVAVVDRPQIALASDLAWLIAIVLLLVVGPGDGGPAWLVGLWGAAGGVGLVVALVGIGASPAGGSARRWFRDHREMAASYMGEFGSARAAAQLVLFGVGAIAGLGALGAVRAAQVFYGPLNTLFAGAFLALVPDGARKRAAPRELRGMMVVATVLVTGVAVGWSIVGLLMPDRWGVALFGDTWEDAEGLMLPMGLAVIAGSLATGGIAGLRSLAAPRLSLRARVIGLPPQALATMVGAAIGGGAGYTWGFAVGNLVVAVIWWAHLATGLRRVSRTLGRADLLRQLAPEGDLRPRAEEVMVL
jgi:hypothetical protein